MRTRLGRPIGALAVAGALLAGGAALTGCTDNPMDRRYCVEIATSVRVEDSHCENREPAYAWRYVQRTSDRPAYGRTTRYRTYDHPVDTRGRDTDTDTRTKGSSVGRSDSSGKSGSSSRSGKTSRSGSSGKSSSKSGRR